MSDDVDNANDDIEKVLSRNIKAIRENARLKQGVAGDCDLCGEHSMRLIDDVCSPCRDRYKLK